MQGDNIEGKSADDGTGCDQSAGVSDDKGGAAGDQATQHSHGGEKRIGCHVFVVATKVQMRLKAMFATLMT